MSEKVCPLKLITSPGGNGCPQYIKCDRSKCAWWIGANEACSIADLASSLEAIFLTQGKGDEKA